MVQQKTSKESKLESFITHRPQRRDKPSEPPGEVKAGSRQRAGRTWAHVWEGQQGRVLWGFLAKTGWVTSNQTEWGFVKIHRVFSRYTRGRPSRLGKVLVTRAVGGGESGPYTCL